MVSRGAYQLSSTPCSSKRNWWTRGQIVYWVGAAGAAQDAGEGTDFDAVAKGFVSITPLQMDLTRFSQMDSVSAWLKP